jgi:hypothetical protein
MMHFHFNEQVVADRRTALHDGARTYRLVERLPARSPWYRSLTRRLRRPRGLPSVRPLSAVGQSTAPVAQP